MESSYRQAAQEDLVTEKVRSAKSSGQSHSDNPDSSLQT